MLKRRVLLAILLMLSHAVAAAASDIAIVVNSDVPLENLSFAEVRKLFTGERQFWSSNVRVTLLIQAAGTRERSFVLRRICEMSEAQFRQFWIAKVFRAEAATGPKVVNSQEAAMEIVAGLPGAVALIDFAQAPKNVKILRVDGRLPGDAGYKLH
jgi:phosphate transport system substrate-binding protein